ncbi:hypothetical protein JYQ62_08755 [Nostoc sp. UHCC 0702]|nr:hypothetical protein JYQ62_08755 [Nostoc sp. UHCC 0702]
MFSSKEREKFFHTQLVKYGINYQKAAKVARIIASGCPDTLLTEEEIRLSKQVCQDWLRQHQRVTSILREHTKIQ